jgi:nucleoside-diphosphate-sugar epimerase
MKTILITGANGLIGRIIARQLKVEGNTLFGIDIAAEGEPSIRFLNEKNTQSVLLQEQPYTKYYQIDMTEKYKLTEIITQIGKVNCVIHMAGLTTNKSAENIKCVNETSTQILFEVCYEMKIDNLILASSVMTVWGKFVDDKIYLKSSNDYQVVTSDVICLPQETSPELRAYIESKIKIEAIARSFFNKYQISSVCLRMGAISSNDSIYEEAGLNTIWCSHSNLNAFIRNVIEFLTQKSKPFFGTYFVCSNNKDCWVDLSDAKRDFGFEAKDSADLKLQEPSKRISGELQQQIKFFAKGSLKTERGDSKHPHPLPLSRKR